MPFPARNRHRKIADFSRFREIVIPFETVNDPRLKTEPCVTCFLFFLSSINAGFSTAILVFTWFILQKERSCLLLNDFMFSCCFYVFLNNFFVPYGWTLNRVGVKFLMSNQRTKQAWHNEFGWLPKSKNSLRTIFQNFV